MSMRVSAWGLGKPGRTAMGVLAAGVLLVAPAARAAEWFVATNGSHTTGDTWPAAFTNLQHALNTAAPGDTILLAGHTFTLGAELAWSNSAVTLQGGYEATEASGAGPRDPAAWPSVVTRHPSATIRLLTLKSVSDAVIRGVTWRGGNASSDYGGGIQVANATNFAILDCRVIGNTITGPWGGHAFGGGISVVNGSGVISNTVFLNNYCSGGGYRQGSGGALYLSGGNVVVRNCVMAGNKTTGSYSNSSGNGGAIFFASGTHAVRNLLAVGNRSFNTDQAPSSGGGLYVAAAAVVTVENATVAGHSSEGLYNLTTNTVVRNSIFAYNVPDIGGGLPRLTNTCIADGLMNGTNGNFAADPRWVEPTFYLGDGSPCLDAGDQSAAAAGLAGFTTRTNGAADSGTVDLGYHAAEGLGIDLDLYVSGTGSDANTGLTPESPLRSVTKALRLAAARTRIHLAPGLYDRTVETFPLVIRETMVQILGTNPAVTVINASGSGKRAIEWSDSIGDNRVEGLTIWGGWDKDYGAGGMLLSVASLVMDGVGVVSNSVSSSWGSHTIGGAIVAEQVWGVIRNSLFKGNSCTGGGAGGRTGIGGAIAFLDGRWLIDRTAFQANQANGGTVNDRGYGGAIYARRGRHDFRSVLMATNTVGPMADSTGSAIFSANAMIVFQQGTLALNRGAAAVYGSPRTTFTGSILWGNAGLDFTNLAESAFQYSCSTGLIEGVRFNITNDPLFAAAATNDFRLLAASPCKDVLPREDWMGQALDLAGQPRIQGKRADMGAYEAPWKPTGSLIQFR